MFMPVFIAFVILAEQINTESGQHTTSGENFNASGAFLPQLPQG
jgi:hypothetical protein